MQFTTLSKWKRRDDILSPYGEYETVNLGIQWVDTLRIVGLSLWTPENVASDRKMQQLIRSVEENGWINKTPADLHLYRVPTGDYTVGTGGNHRPVLASELGIAQIQASVDVIIPIGDMKQETLQSVHGIDAQIKWLEHEARELALFLRSDSIHGNEYEAENRRYNECFEEIGRLYQERRTTLITEAIRLGYMREEERRQSTI